MRGFFRSEPYKNRKSRKKPMIGTEQIMTTITRDEIAALAEFDTPTIANALETLQIAPVGTLGTDFRMITDSAKPFVGIAATATMSEQRGGKFEHLEAWLGFLDAIAAVGYPVIAVFKDNSRQPVCDAMIGEGMSLAMKGAGAIGAILDGCMRDIRQVDALDFPVICKGLTPDRGKIKFHQFQIPVTLGGTRIAPGDLIHADENGAIVIPAGRTQEIISAAAAVVEKEAQIFALLRDPDFRVGRLRDFYGPALDIAERERLNPA
jgi:4-hydroxy-4-methyl-2-oxoglutarate aldolase